MAGVRLDSIGKFPFCVPTSGYPVGAGTLFPIGMTEQEAMRFFYIIKTLQVTTSGVIDMETILPEGSGDLAVGPVVNEPLDFQGWGEVDGHVADDPGSWTIETPSDDQKRKNEEYPNDEKSLICGPNHFREARIGHPDPREDDFPADPPDPPYTKEYYFNHVPEGYVLDFPWSVTCQIRAYSAVVDGSTTYPIAIRSGGLIYPQFKVYCEWWWEGCYVDYIGTWLDDFFEPKTLTPLGVLNLGNGMSKTFQLYGSEGIKTLNEFELDPHAAWEFANASGQPVWNAATGDSTGNPNT